MHEVRKIILAGGQQFVDAAGDFIFCSFAERPFRIIIDGQPLTVRVGDKLRPEKRFRNFQIENLDDSNPVAVTLVVGEGDYNSQIIQGEVTVNPGVRGADGRWRDDTRRDLEGIIWPVDMGKNFSAGETLYQSAAVLMASNDEDWISYNETEKLVVAVSKGNDVGDDGLAKYFDPKLGLIGTKVLDYSTTRIPSGAPDGAENWGTFNTTAADVVAYKDGFLVCSAGNYASGSPMAVFYTDGTGLSGVKKFGSANGRNLISMAVSDDLIYCLFSDGEVAAIDINGNAHGSWATDNAGYDGDIRAYGGFFYLRYLNRTIKKMDSEFNAVATWDSTNWDVGFESGGFSVVEGLYYAKSDSSEHLRAVPMSDITSPITLAAEVEAECSRFVELTWRQEDLPLIDADLEVTRNGDRITVRGECIKAVLTAMTGRVVQGDYLDAVFAFEYVTGEAWHRKVSRNSGGRSFAGADIADDFTMTLPTRVRLRVDDTLELSDPQLTL